MEKRNLRARDIVAAIQKQHQRRAINRGRAQWRVVGSTGDGRAFVVVYDHPHGADTGAVRIVSVWPL
jgi:uncharacterized DUF497 family protein